MQQFKFERTSITAEIESVVQSKKPEFVYVRGRRRVGKSWILKQLATKYPDQCFYFMAGPDASSLEIIKQFVFEFAQFSKDSTLQEKKVDLLNWKTIFEHILYRAKQNKKPHTIILDEIQWIAKEGSGFLGKLKEAWIDWEDSGLLKVILCGSSNKFFNLKTAGSETILRGLKTRSDIYVTPISLSECYKKRFKHWLPEEAAVLYFLTGGIPYYLNQVNPKQPFIAAINDAFFCSTSIYLSEIDEILSLDFNKQGLKTVKTILQAIGTNGCSEAHIIKKTKIAKSTVHTVLEKLINYKLVDMIQSSSSGGKGNESGAKYLIADFYLLSYFQLILPIVHQIEKNKENILFKFSASNLYIENYTGPLFEYLVKYILLEKNLNLKLFSKLDLRSMNFKILHYWDKENQVDLIVEDVESRVSRAIEIKWLEIKSSNYNEIKESLQGKNYPVSAYFTRRDHIFCQRKSAELKNKPELITVLDLIN